MVDSSPTASLRIRIFASVILLVAMCCLAGVIGWLGQSSLLTGINQLEQQHELTTRVLEIDRQTQQLKSSAERFIRYGTSATHRSAEETLSSLSTEIASVVAQNQNAELDELLHEMDSHLSVFGEQLGLAAEERSLRKDLLESKIPSQAMQVRSLITQWQDRVGKQPDSGPRQAAAACAQAFGEAHRSLLQYFVDPDSQLIDQMLSSLAEARRASDFSDQTLVGKVEDESESGRLTAALAEFESLALRAYQATRGFLYYSNVVMSGEISEFTYYSDQVKEHVQKAREASRQQRAESVQRTLTLNVAALLVTLMIAALVAMRLSYLIVRPITQLTDAFRTLASGETLTEIPGTDRTDEIGRMSRAARVFSDKNRETRALLRQTQTLSDELTQQAKALEESNRELDNFAYAASHDLKSPLRGIKSLAEWVQEDSHEDLSESSMEYLSLMQQRVAAMESLLNDLLEYSRIGRQRANIETVDVRELVESIVELVDNPKEMTIDILGAMPTIETTRAPLYQVLLNLITNSLKYGNDHGRVQIECVDREDWIQFSVKDDGIGVDPRFHSRIFQMFQRVAGDHAEGTGMGLALSKKHVESHGGTISVESDVGRGAVFQFTWPKSVPQVEQHRNSLANETSAL